SVRLVGKESVGAMVAQGHAGTEKSPKPTSGAFATGPLSAAAIASALLQAGGMVLLTFRAVRGILVWPPAWWGEFIDQAWQMIRRTALPVAISTLAFGFGAAGIQAGQFAEMVGSVDRIGSSFVTATVREFAPWITGMVVGGVAGTAICADLGARRIREELDALGVLGVDPLKALVVPRFLALGVVAVLMSMLAIAFGAISGLIAAVGLFNGTAAGYFATFGNNFVVPELLA